MKAVEREKVSRAAISRRMASSLSSTRVNLLLYQDQMPGMVTKPSVDDVVVAAGVLQPRRESHDRGAELVRRVLSEAAVGCDRALETVEFIGHGGSE